MELSILLAQQIAGMLLIVLAGYGIMRFRLVDEEALQPLIRINIFLICPCAVFHSFKADFSMTRLTGFLLALLAGALIHALFIIVDTFFRKPLKLKATESASLIYSNGLNLIIPLVLATLDEEMLLYTCAFVMVQNVLTWTHCKGLMTGKIRLNPKDLLNINVISIGVGFLFFLLGWKLPAILDTAVSGLGNTIGPINMLIIGMSMGGLNLRKTFTNGRVYCVVAGRLLVFPILAILVLRYSGIQLLHPQAREIFMVTVLAASSCSASMVPQLAGLYGEDTAYASAINVVSLIGCVVSMPLMVLVYQML